MSGDDTTSLDAALAALVPQIAFEFAARPGAHHKTVDGSMLSADISGFTALTERLSDKGKEGAEEITNLINRCFTALIDEAYAYGGEVLKFGGDAILVLFRDADHELRAAAAGLAMHAALRESAAAKAAKLDMTVGVAAGPFDVFLVGSAPRELLITGNRASHVIELEGGAGQGETLIGENIVAKLPEGASTEALALGHRLTGELEAPRSGPLVRTVEHNLLVELVPEDVREHFAAFARLGGEHRIATVAFVKLSGVADQLATAGAEQTCQFLHQFTEELQTICARFGVSSLHTDIAEDGAKFLLCAGAPVSRGDSDDAMLESAIEIAAIRTPFTVKIGVQRGRIFAGFLGSDYRRTYTLMGDDVNTAARMLGPAQNRDVIAVNDVVKNTRTVFVTDPLEPFTVKGKTEPINASRVIATTDSNRIRQASVPLIGREVQLDQLRSVLANQGAIADLVGPAGAGKSRLLAATHAEATKSGHTIIRGQCSPYSQATPYALGRIVLRNILGIDPFADAENAGDILIKMIRHHVPELEPMAPVLAIPLGGQVPASAEANAIDPKFLRSQINTKVGDLLEAVLPANTVFIIEDTHWIDDPSAELFAAVLQRGVELGWTGITTRRPVGTWLASDMITHVEVLPLTSDDIRRLAVVSSETDLTDRQLDIIVEQAAGNPLFAIELAKAANTREQVPDSVEQLISERIDALEPEQRHGMRVASVFGYELTQGDLAAVLAPAQIPALRSLDEFVSVDNKGNVTFTHALYRDVAYEGLPFAERRRIHRAVGDHLESATEDPEDIAGLLALHFAEAKDSARTWTYGVAAGDAARAQAATLEAATNYERALGVASRLHDLDSSEVARVADKLGEAASTAGDFDGAERAYRRVRALAETRHEECRAMVNIGRVREYQGRYSDAARWYSRAAELVTSDDRTIEALRTRSDLHYQRAGLLHRKGEHEQCILEARMALGTAEDADDLPAMAAALQRLHLATMFHGRKDRIGYGLKALEIYREIGEFDRQASVLNNLGVEHYFAGRWTEAADHYRLATATGLRAGSAVDGMVGAANAGEILSDQGHWDDAIEQFEAARRNWDGGRYPMGAAMVKLYLAVAHGRRGADEQSELTFDEAIQQLTDLKLHDEMIAAKCHRAEQRAHRGVEDPELGELREHVEPNTAAHRHLLRSAALIAGTATSPAFDALLGDLEEVEGYERALALRVLDFLAGKDTDESWAPEAQKLLDALGVVGLQPLPDRSI